MSQVQEPEARNWLFTMIDSLSHDQLIRMCVTLWALWHARRKAIHEGVFQSPLSTHCFTDNFLAELNQGRDQKKPKAKTGAAASGKPAWIPSATGVAQLNVDAGVTRKRERGAVAAVARAADGSYLGASAVIFDGFNDPEVLEALAVREGLSLAQDLLLPKICVASDCLSVINDLKAQNLGRYSSILHEISATGGGFVEASFVHESRVTNKEPHLLAQSVLGLQAGRFVWLGDPPTGICMPRFWKS